MPEKTKPGTPVQRMNKTANAITKVSQSKHDDGEFQDLRHDVLSEIYMYFVKIWPEVVKLVTKTADIAREYTAMEGDEIYDDIEFRIAEIKFQNDVAEKLAQWHLDEITRLDRLRKTIDERCGEMGAEAKTRKGIARKKNLVLGLVRGAGVLAGFTGVGLVATYYAFDWTTDMGAEAKDETSKAKLIKKTLEEISKVTEVVVQVSDSVRWIREELIGFRSDIDAVYRALGRTQRLRPKQGPITDIKRRAEEILMRYKEFDRATVDYHVTIQRVCERWPINERFQIEWESEMGI